MVLNPLPTPLSGSAETGIAMRDPCCQGQEKSPRIQTLSRPLTSPLLPAPTSADKRESETPSPFLLQGRGQRPRCRKQEWVRPLALLMEGAEVALAQGQENGLTGGSSSSRECCSARIRPVTDSHKQSTQPSPCVPSELPYPPLRHYFLTPLAPVQLPNPRKLIITHTLFKKTWPQGLKM